MKNHNASVKHRRSVEHAIANAEDWPRWGTLAPKRIPLGSRPEATEPKTRSLGTWVPPFVEFEAAGFEVRKPPDGTLIPVVEPCSVPRNPSKKRKAEIALDRAGGDGPQQWLAKHRKRWCMAEAQREVWRESFQEGSIASISHDKRKSDILVVFQLSHPDTLECTRGVLGLERNVKGCAKSIKAAINRAIKRFCTRDCDAPRVGPLADADGDLESKVRNAVRGAYADGCAADQKALAELAADGNSLPQCHDRCRDKAHSLRSVLRRPCLRMSQEAQTIMSAVLLNKKSAVKLIDNSDSFREMWLESSSKVNCPLPGQRCGLGSAPQRFESEARPLANVAVMPDRFLNTCVLIANARANQQEGKLMKRHLQLMDAKALLLIAAMADAINEGLRLIREAACLLLCLISSVTV